MSRTYRKRIIKTTAGGDNTSFYRLRRRKIKNIGRMQLRRLLANFNIDDVSNLWEEPNIPMRDEWAEPTDGHYGITKRDYKKLVHNEDINSWYDYSKLGKKVNYYIKPKNRKHYRIV